MSFSEFLVGMFVGALLYDFLGDRSWIRTFQEHLKKDKTGKDKVKGGNNGN